MRLYLVLFPFLFLLQNNLWSWQTTTTMTKTEIKEQLVAKELALKTVLKENNLSIATALTAEQLAVLEQTYTLLGIAEAPQDIGKKTFVDYVQDWVKDFISILENEKRTDIEIYVADIIRSLQEKIEKPNFPISMILWKHLSAEINKLSSPTTAEGLRGALLNGFNSFDTYIDTKFELTKHFKENRKTYNKIKKKELNEQVMIANNFHTWLNGLLEPAKAKQERQEERAEERAEREEDNQKEFNKELANWDSEIAANKIELLEDSIKHHLVNKELFINKLKKSFVNKYKVVYPTLTELISSTILNDIKGIKVLKLTDLAAAFSNASTAASEYVRKNKEDIKIKYKKDASLPSFAMIRSVILEAKTEVAANDLNLVYWNWKKSIKSTIEQVAMYKGWSTSQLLKTTKLIANFKLAFAGGAEPNSGFLYEVFKGEFNSVGKDLITYEDFKALFSETIAELDHAIATHNEEVMNTLSGEEIKTLIESIALPNAENLASAIFDSRYYKPRLKPTTGDTIGVQFIFDDATKLLVNLAPTTKTVGQGVGITLDRLSSIVEQNGAHGYTFDINPDSLYQVAPQYDASSKSTVTKFDFSIQIDKSRGSTSKEKTAIKGSSNNVGGGYTHTTGTEHATLKGTNTANTTGDNTENTDQTDVVHTDNITNQRTDETYSEDSDTYGVDAGISTPIGNLGVNYSKTKTEGKSNSDVTTRVDETVTTTTAKTVTNKIDTKTIEDVNLTEEKTIKGHAYNVSASKTTYDQTTSGKSEHTSKGMDLGGIKVRLELHSSYDSAKKTVTGTFKNIEVSSSTLDKMTLKKINTTPSPLVISVK